MASHLSYPQCPLPDNTECATYLNRGQSMGLTVATESGFVSAVAVLGLFCVILTKVARKIWNPPAQGWKFFRSPLDVYMLSLLVSDLIQGLGKILDIKWLNDGIVQCGSFCTAQGVIQQLGETGVAQATLAIAIHTFFVIFFRKGAQAIRVAFAVVCAIWLYVILFTAIAAARHKTKNQNYDTPTPYWCWIGDRFTSERLAGEYFWLWFTAFFSLALYVPLFFCLRGNLEPDAKHWWKIRFHRLHPQALPGGTEKSPAYPVADAVSPQTKIAREGAVMLLYPASYILLVLPDSICRWIGFEKIPAGASFFATTIFGLSGLINVTLLLYTRKGLLMLEEAAPLPVQGAIFSSSESIASGSPVLEMGDEGGL